MVIILVRMPSSSPEFHILTVIRISEESHEDMRNIPLILDKKSCIALFGTIVSFFIGLSMQHG